MFYTVRTAVDKHNAVWMAVVPYDNAVKDFKQVITDTEQELTTQEEELDGYAMDKGARKEKMVRKALTIANEVFAYAEDNSDLVLREKMDVSYSDLIAPRDAVVAQKCQGIHDEANVVIASLAPYGVLPADLTDLLTFITDYEAAISAPRTAITVRKGATANIEKLIKAGTTILTKRMDKLMSEFQDSSPLFYQEYFNARIVVNTGAKKDEVPVPPVP